MALRTIMNGHGRLELEGEEDMDGAFSCCFACLSPAYCANINLCANSVTVPRAVEKEKVNHPDHYGGAANPYEAIKVIEAWKLGFNLGNAVKYLSRSNYKGSRLTDLEKARWYIDREINNIKKGD